MARRAKMIFVTIVAAGLGASCVFQGLRQDLEVMAQLGEISGHVIAAPETSCPIFVVLYRAESEKQVLYAYYLAYSSGAFRFVVPPGSYYLFAFEDRNEDAAFKPDERAGWFGDHSPIRVGPGTAMRGIALPVQQPSSGPAAGRNLKTLSLESKRVELKASMVGVVVRLSDKRFSAHYASKGLWEPIKFLDEPGGGIFFLEPYTSRKTPVLFVHGAGGYPQQWASIIGQLDRTHFQPWILHYPSGLRLGLLGEFLEKYLAELHVRYRFDKLYIVAHSMGGLISRCALNHNIESRPTPFIGLLITIATPWQGHSAATYGVEQSPVVVPSWYDMAPDSPFLRGLRAIPLPPEVEFDLLFGYRGDAQYNGQLSDGTVMLSSILDDDMQKAATVVNGFDEDHTGILQSPALAQCINRLLARAAARDGKP
jgi:pimeloyl-ACP methyl ester carboxylesterase